MIQLSSIENQYSIRISAMEFR
ncbi:hypothetical protein PM8797T_31845 [Gimesia maris DSM 8797]|nr:hypothetical protein PM8797T_31845 [Gimesia maris DSM 8797]